MKQNYKLQGQHLVKDEEEKDLVVVKSDLKSGSQCLANSRKANTILGYIIRNFECKTPDVISATPHRIRSPESMQRRATKLFPCLSSFRYEEHLKPLDRFSLKDRRIRGDPIETFNTLRNINNVNHDNFSNSHPD